MRIQRLSIWVFLLALTLSRAAYSAPLHTPIFNDGEKLRYKISGVRNVERALGVPPPIEYVNSFQHLRDESGKKIIRQLTNEIRDNNTVVNWRFDYADTYPHTRSLNFSRSLISGGQIEAFSEYASFNDPFLNFPENIVHPVATPFILGGIDRKAGSPQADVYSWLQDGRPFHLFVEFAGEESLKAPAGTFKTWKARLKVDRKQAIEPWGIFGKLIASMIPDFTLWYDSAPPYRLVKVRVEFSPGTPGAPLYYQELVEIK